MGLVHSRFPDPGNPNIAEIFNTVDHGVVSDAPRADAAAMLARINLIRSLIMPALTYPWIFLQDKFASYAQSPSIPALQGCRFISRLHVSLKGERDIVSIYAITTDLGL